MVALRTTLLVAILDVVFILAMPWGNEALSQTQALDIRAPGDMSVFGETTGNALEKRAQLIPFVGVMPAMVMASVTLGWCYRSTFDQACLALMAGTVTLALGYAALWWTYMGIYERAQWSRDDRIQANNFLENQQRAIELPDVITDEREERERRRRKDKIEEERRTWADPYKQALRIYGPRCKNHPVLNETFEQAQKKFKLAGTALDSFAQATEPSVRLSEFRDGQDGTLSRMGVETLMKEADEGIDEIGKKMDEITKKDISDMKDLEELPFFKDNDPDLTGPLSRRGLNDGMPRLVKESNDNCHSQHCHRLWYSTTIPMGRKRGHITSKDVIHNFYSTPVNFHFDDEPEHRSILKRGSNDDDDDTVDCEDTLTLNDTPVLSRVSVVPGNDTKSLDDFVQSYLKDADGTEKNFKNALMQTNMKNFNSERWQCVNTDTKDGPKHGMDLAQRAVAIFTKDASMLHADTAPLLSHCFDIA